jgi:hypothetical protein
VQRKASKRHALTSASALPLSSSVSRPENGTITDMKTVLLAIFLFSSFLSVFLSANATDYFAVIAISILLGLVCVVLFIAFAGNKAVSGRVGLLASVLFLCLCIISSVAISGWPLRLLFHFSRASFDSVASLAKNGQQIITPVRIGLYTIKKVEIWDGSVCFWTETSGDHDGFVNTTPQGVQRFNVWSTLQLKKDWQFLWED